MRNYMNGVLTSNGFTNFTVLSLSFDWEIFPDATCAQGSHCAGHPGNSNWPDIELLVDGNALPVWQMLATTPAGGGDPQAIGTASLTFFRGGGSRAASCGPLFMRIRPPART